MSVDHRSKEILIRNEKATNLYRKGFLANFMPDEKPQKTGVEIFANPYTMEIQKSKATCIKLIIF